MPKDRGELFEFEWNVDSAGYEITISSRPALSGQRTLLSAASESATHVIRPKGGELRAYKPFADAGVARKFSSLKVIDEKLDTDEVLGFAAKYGILGIAKNNTPERMEDWKKLASYLWLIFEHIDHDRLDIAQGLYNHANIAPPISVRVTGAGKAGKSNYSLKLYPSSLAAAIWLMVADELTKGKKLQPCELSRCKEWFLRRTNKRFCSDKCKMSWHRQPAA